MNASTNGAHAKESNEGTATLAGTDRHLEEVRTLVKASIRDGRLTNRNAAKEMGVHESPLSSFLSGRYAGDSDKIARKAEAWLHARGERIATRAIAAATPEFYETETSMALLASLMYVQSLNDMLLVIGVPGVGKTTTLREFQRRHPCVWIATMAANSPGLWAAQLLISEAVGVAREWNSFKMGLALRAKVRDTNGVLIIDEAHHLGLKALDAIRDIHDSCGIAVVLCGGPELERHVRAMPQLHSRIGLQQYLEKPMAGDLAACLEAWGITGKAERKLLAEIAERSGALRRVTKVLKLATSMAGQKGETMGFAHLQDAAAVLSPQSTDY